MLWGFAELHCNRSADAYGKSACAGIISIHIFRGVAFPLQDVCRALAEKHPFDCEGWTSVTVTGLCVGMGFDFVRDRNKSPLQEIPPLSWFGFSPKHSLKLALRCG